MVSLPPRPKWLATTHAGVTLLLALLAVGSLLMIRHRRRKAAAAISAAAQKQGAAAGSSLMITSSGAPGSRSSSPSTGADCTTTGLNTPTDAGTVESGWHIIACRTLPDLSGVNSNAITLGGCGLWTTFDGLNIQWLGL